LEQEELQQNIMQNINKHIKQQPNVS